MKEYAALYKELKTDNEELHSTVKLLDEKIVSLEKGKAEMREKVSQDNEVISHLN